MHLWGSLPLKGQAKKISSQRRKSRKSDTRRSRRVQCHQRERNFQDVIMVVSNAAEASRDEDCRTKMRVNSSEVVYDLSEKSSSTEAYETI